MRNPGSNSLSRILIHLGAWLPLLRTLLDSLTNNLSINPIQDIEQRFGRAAITLLVITLACTPLNTVLHWQLPRKYRRTLGLYAYLYAVLHVTVFVFLDYALDISLMLQDVGTKRYVIVGAIVFILLSTLALTSFDYWKKRLGKNWKRLHRWIYLISPLAVLHFAWARKGNLFQLQGDILLPLAYAVVVALLLALRVPKVRSAIQSQYYKMRA